MSNLLKAEYNLQLANARTALTAAKAIRETLIASNPDLKGPSQGHLSDALTSAYKARTFSGVTNDLPAEDNTFRDSTKIGGRKTRARLAAVNSSPRPV